MESLSSTLKQKLDCLLNPLWKRQRQRQRQMHSSSPGKQGKIQKVPPYLRERNEFDKYYSPKVVSIGPIHYPKGEEYKKMWASIYLEVKEGEGQPKDAQQLLRNIRHEIQALKLLYTEDVIQRWKEDDDGLAWILFVDGCASLHIMDQLNQLSNLKALEYIAQQDLLLVENQLPYKVLKILSEEDDSVLREFITFLLQSRGFLPPQSLVVKEADHLLDLLIKSMVNKHTGIQIERAISPTHRNIQELITTSGIQIKKDREKTLTSIHFQGGTLYIPPFTVDKFTAQTFLNMIAYEMCPDNSNTNYEISNYVFFLNSLIDNADDVKALRKSGVLKNHLGSDEEVAEIFNTVTTNLWDTGIYDQVWKDIEKFYKNPHICNKVRICLLEFLNVSNWFVELQRNHFNTPWKIIGLISAILGFVLTVVTLKKELGSKKD